MEENNQVTEEDLKNENLHPRAQYIECDEETKRCISLLRYAFSEMYKCMDECLDQNRETSLAYTKMEEAQMWAIKSITHGGK